MKMGEEVKLKIFSSSLSLSFYDHIGSLKCVNKLDLEWCLYLDCMV